MCVRYSDVFNLRQTCEWESLTKSFQDIYAWNRKIAYMYALLFMTADAYMVEIYF